MLVRMIFASVALAALGACASVNSHTVGDAQARGVAYSLPTVTFNLKLIGVTDAEQFDTNVMLGVEPEYAVDTRAGALALDYSPGLLSQDTVNIEVDNHGLLRTFSGQYNSRAVQTFTALGRVIGLAPEAGAGEPYDISSEVVDPSDPADLSNGAAVLTRAMQDWAARRYANLGSAPAPQRRRLYRAAFMTSFGLEWRWLGDAAPALPAAPVARLPAACGAGVCARPLRQGRLIVWRCGPVTPPRGLDPATATPRPQDCNHTNGVQISATALSIPNNAPSVRLPVNGGLFADRTRNVGLVNGMVVDFDATGGSEAEGVLTSIGSALVAIPAGAVERVRGEANVLKEQTALVNAQTGLVRAQQSYRAALATPTTTNDSEQTEEPQTPTTEEPTEAGSAENGAVGEVETPNETASEGEEREDNADDAPVNAPEDVALDSWSVLLFGPPQSIPVRN
ncbi:hypothetical protein [Vitreimonas flagellata]|uniref:hypothetical protein n=1 Tax=Vitreimonas flagellata TaxID=2560861 RepID=UPI0010756B40|nr:hypothetical protein [Vitreimonas flagellata]